MRSNRGSTLVFLLLLMTIIFIILTSLVSLEGKEYAAVTDVQKVTQALYYADAGVQFAMFRMATVPSWRSRVTPGNLAGGAMPLCSTFAPPDNACDAPVPPGATQAAVCNPPEGAGPARCDARAFFTDCFAGLWTTAAPTGCGPSADCSGCAADPIKFQSCNQARFLTQRLANFGGPIRGAFRIRISKVCSTMGSGGNPAGCQGDATNSPRQGFYIIESTGSIYDDSGAENAPVLPPNRVNVARKVRACVELTRPAGPPWSPCALPGSPNDDNCPFNARLVRYHEEYR